MVDDQVRVDVLSEVRTEAGSADRLTVGAGVVGVVGLVGLPPPPPPPPQETINKILKVMGSSFLFNSI